jgi:L-serine dehydratase
MIINSSKDVIKYCEQQKLSIWELAVQHEKTNSDLDEREIYLKMTENFSYMKEAVHKGLYEQNDSPIKPKMFSGDGKSVLEYVKKGDTLSGDIMTKAMAYAFSVMEVNCSMGKIVACPTAGSCGVVPAALLITLENKKMDEEMAVRALFVVGLIGSLIAKNASLSGATGGCQAEIGSAAAMAAGAVTFMCGGTNQMIFDAAAIAINNMMGLVCDPVAGLVEVPCVKRNAIGVSNALICGDMVLAGLSSTIPFDEVVWAMDRVGKSMHPNLKETANGGIAVTPTALKLKKEIFVE